MKEILKQKASQMKKYLLLTLSLWLGLGAAGMEDSVSIFAGRPQRLPFEVAGEWKIVSAHGRVLATGTAERLTELVVSTPELTSGSMVEAELVAGQDRKPIKIYAPDILSGVKARIALGSKIDQQLTAAGVESDRRAELLFKRSKSLAEGKIEMIFTVEKDFPIEIPTVYEEITLLQFKRKGSLGVEINEGAGKSSIGNQGNAEVIRIRAAGKSLIYFQPGFKLEEIDSILLIKQLLVGKEKK